MADDKQKNADFIDRVVGDAKNPPETRMLTGWFGDSGEEGYRRLYTDAELNNYVDIPDDAILYSEPLRDSQPSGCVLVWIKRDAVLKPGGSAASRAARFLQGQVQQDFASAGAAGSLEKAGLRCVTEVPCGEVTGFTGQCTKQPEVGGAWPCITAVPHCLEVTGFTGKCTHAPWPNPTRYFGCTYLHCPTNDLTHVPHICNIVASGLPGCVVVNPPQGGDPAQKVGAAADAGTDEKPPETSIPGCGYTKTWGVCETHLLGCGTAAQGNAAAAPGAEAFTAGGCTRMRPVCYPTEVCHYTKPPQCVDTISQGMEPCTKPIDAALAAQPASAICATAIGCDITLFCHTRIQPLCFPTLICPTQPRLCFPIPSPFCPVTQACPFNPGGGGDPAQRHFAGFGAAAAVVPNTQAPGCMLTGVVPCPTTPHGCTVPPTSPDFKCTQSGPACPPPPTVPQTQCTQSGPQCPTSCGPDCQSLQPNCTSIGQACGHNPCTHDPVGCPSLGIACTVVPPCPPPPTSPQLDCTLGCPVTNPVIACANPADAQAFGAAAARPAPLTQGGGCPPSDLVACSLFGGCPSLPQQFAAAGSGGGCTQSGPQCPTHARPQCTYFGPGCPPTPATICTQFAPCKTHQPLHCPSPQFECTMFCTHGAPGCPQTQSPACLGPITVSGPQCPVHTGVNCPSQICQSIACQSIACQPGGGVQEEFGAPAPRPAPFTPVGCPHSDFVACSQFGGCPTIPQGDCTFFGCPSRGIDCTVVVCTHAGPLCPPNTAATVCTQYPQCPHPSLGGQFCPVTELCPVTRLCPVTPLCHVTQLCPITTGGPQCPVHSGFNCPSAIGCQSVACQSIACHPGDGGEQQVFVGQHGVPVPQQTQGVLCTQVGPQCPTQQLSCTQFGPQCPPNTAAGSCTQFGALCPPPSQQGFCPPYTTGGPQCPPVTGNFRCQSAHCQTIACPQGGGGEAFAQQAVGAPQSAATVCTQVGAFCQHTSGPTICTQIGPQCPHTAGCPTPLCTHIGALCQHTSGPTICTQIGPQCPHTAGCPTPLCTHIGALCQHTSGPTICTQIGPQCPRTAGCPTPLCTQLACPNTLATVCTQSGPQCPQAFGAARFDQSTDFCPTSEGCGGVAHPQAAAAVPHTQLIQCHPSLIDACPTRLIIQCNPSVIDACPTRLCTHQFIQCNPSAIDGCPTRFGCPTQNPVQCPPHSGFNCPSQLGCRSIACGQSVACQPGGGGQREFAAFGAAPGAAGGGGGIGVTAWLDCTHFGFQCPPFFTQFEQECVVQPIFTFALQCVTPPPPTPACPTAHCPPRSHHFMVCTAFGPQCPGTVVFRA